MWAILTLHTSLSGNREEPQDKKKHGDVKMNEPLRAGVSSGERAADARIPAVMER